MHKHTYLTCKIAPVPPYADFLEKVLDIVFPRRQLPESAPSFARLVLDVIAAIMVYDVGFFASHAWVHSSRYILKKVHAKHHEATSSALRRCMHNPCLSI